MTFRLRCFALPVRKGVRMLSLTIQIHSLPLLALELVHANNATPIGHKRACNSSYWVVISWGRTVSGDPLQSNLFQSCLSKLSFSLQIATFPSILPLNCHLFFFKCVAIDGVELQIIILMINSYSIRSVAKSKLIFEQLNDLDTLLSKYNWNS